ncbi:hypothetical protein QN386_17880 [Pseudomonas sp. CCI3.2]|uniref:hypothetical protein n=1 Tax=unclassified Pseudomonas TaxID=196821 RepID=UPI002B23E2B6|nr:MULTISPECIES: hypothetical protein [unclassified Pseudomonas]MEB0078063.1 hypothetical protein [Pseudomonas sp. MH10out]MEB0103179.1 hypothetical protein [Pseudomonas sp. CCI3.2]MEB0133415.1 hypothetical protein [Pseudomonas sp. CCI2.4]
MINRWRVDQYDLVLEEAGEVVTYDDYLASHAYNEITEQINFEVYAKAENLSLNIEPDMGTYKSSVTNTLWCGWVACAKRRAMQ